MAVLGLGVAVLAVLLARRGLGGHEAPRPEPGDLRSPDPSPASERPAPSPQAKPATVVVAITNPPASGRLEHGCIIYSRARREIVVHTFRTHTGPAAVTLDEQGVCDFWLIATDGTPLYAHATFTPQRDRSIDVPVTLQPTGTLRFRVSERGSGKPPADSGRIWPALWVELEGHRYKLVDFAGTSVEKKIADGQELVFPCPPPGRWRLSVTDATKKNYKPWQTDFAVSAGEELKIEAQLESLGD